MSKEDVLIKLLAFAFLALAAFSPFLQAQKTFRDGIAQV
jgi:hypothetical protein